MFDKRSCAVVIPAYKPESHFIDLVKDLVSRDMNVFVVDDGSGDQYASRFISASRLGAKVVAHTSNMGKGRAIKTGVAAVRNSGKDYIGIITADADGQHCADDIEKIAVAIAQNPESLVLGVRSFDNDVPIENLMGNTATRLVYTLSTRIMASDTQTGLRGFPRSTWDALLQISGERYEYEMNMLLKVPELGLRLVEVPIRTIYLDNNSASHFNHLTDSVKIYAAILRFSAFKIVSFCIDFFMYSVFLTLALPSSISYALARALSLIPGVYAYFMAARVSSIRLPSALFPSGRLVWILILVVGSASVQLIETLFGITDWWVKLPVDALLFVFAIMKRKDTGVRGSRGY